MNRRTALAALAASLPAGGAGRRYRVGIIGHTGRGNYGHDWERSWAGFANVEVAAVADPDPAGRAQARERSAARAAYADYRDMLRKEKPDIVTICPRWLDQRVAMVRAAAEAGAHILLEKPFAPTLAEADIIVALIEKHNVKLQLGHTARAVAVTPLARQMVRDGRIGEVMEVRARGKEDRRAGGEDLMVLGTHCFDLMRYFLGDPEWVTARITAQGRDVTPAMERDGTEPIGKIAGDNITATFGFAGGVPAHFASRKSEDSSGQRFGVTFYGSKGTLFLPLTAVPSDPPYLMLSTAWAGGVWERIPYPAGQVPTREQTNALMAADLLAAIEENRQPVCSARDGLWTIEMVAAIYQAHYAGRRLALPLRHRGTSPSPPHA